MIVFPEDLPVVRVQSFDPHVGDLLKSGVEERHIVDVFIIGFSTIVTEAGQRADPVVEVGEPNGERVDVRVRDRKLLGDVFRVFPVERHQSSSRRRLPSASCNDSSMMRRANGSVVWLSDSIASRIAT